MSQNHPKHETPPSTPRWVKVLLIVFVVLLVLVIIMHLLGFGFGSHRISAVSTQWVFATLDHAQPIWHWLVAAYS